MSGPLLEVSGLAVEFRTGRGRPPVRAVDEVDLHVGRGETLAIVGESGSGKSTLGNAVLGLVPVAAGRITFDGEDVTEAPASVRRRLSRSLQCVFQDPYGSLNPSRTVRQTLAEPLLVHERPSRAELDDRVAAALRRVGLEPADADRLPARFSGGQRQRIAIARALMLDPLLVICDEPVSALDLSVQARVLNLLAEIQAQTGLSYLFVSHDLSVVRRVAHRIVVMRRGRIVETGDARQIYEAPRHPYTKALLAAAPVPDPAAQRERRRAGAKAVACR